MLVLADALNNGFHVGILNATVFPTNMAPFRGTYWVQVGRDFFTYKAFVALGMGPVVLDPYYRYVGANDVEQKVQDACGSGITISRIRSLNPMALAPLCGLSGINTDQSSDVVSPSAPVSVPPPISDAVESATTAPSSVVPLSPAARVPESHSQFHVSRTESVDFPSQSEINNATRVVVQCLRNGQWMSVGLFRTNTQFWIADYNAGGGPGIAFYTYAAFQEQNMGHLFLAPGSFFAQSPDLRFRFRIVNSIAPFIAEACQSGMHIFANTGTGVVEACGSR
jgi:hypothetical protein